MAIETVLSYPDNGALQKEVENADDRSRVIAAV